MVCSPDYILSSSIVCIALRMDYVRSILDIHYNSRRRFLPSITIDTSIIHL